MHGLTEKWRSEKRSSDAEGQRDTLTSKAISRVTTKCLLVPVATTNSSGNVLASESPMKHLRFRTEAQALLEDERIRKECRTEGQSKVYKAGVRKMIAETQGERKERRR